MIWAIYLIGFVIAFLLIRARWFGPFSKVRFADSKEGQEALDVGTAILLCAMLAAIWPAILIFGIYWVALLVLGKVALFFAVPTNDDKEDQS